MKILNTGSLLDQPRVECGHPFNVLIRQLGVTPCSLCSDITDSTCEFLPFPRPLSPTERVTPVATITSNEHGVRWQLQEWTPRLAPGVDVLGVRVELSTHQLYLHFAGSISGPWPLQNLGDRATANLMIVMDCPCSEVSIPWVAPFRLKSAAVLGEGDVAAASIRRSLEALLPDCSSAVFLNFKTTQQVLEVPLKACGFLSLLRRPFRSSERGSWKAFWSS